jgi:hypothetical protein
MDGLEFPALAAFLENAICASPQQLKKKTSRNERPVCTFARPFFFFWKLGNIRRDA